MFIFWHLTQVESTAKILQNEVLKQSEGTARQGWKDPSLLHLPKHCWRSKARRGQFNAFAQHFRFAWRKWKIISVHFKSEVLYEFLAVCVWNRVDLVEPIGWLRCTFSQLDLREREILTSRRILSFAIKEISLYNTTLFVGFLWQFRKPIFKLYPDEEYHCFLDVGDCTLHKDLSLTHRSLFLAN